MDIKHLQILYRRLPISIASLGLPIIYSILQPTISKMIKNLETELGVELFDRSRKQLILTDAGRVVLDQAKLIDKAFSQFRNGNGQFIRFEKGTYTHRALADHRRFFLPRILSRFHAGLSQYHLSISGGWFKENRRIRLKMI